MVDVEREIHARQFRYLAYGVVDWVALGDAPPGFGVGYHIGVVQPHDGVESGESGRDHLRAARESGEEVRLDEPGGYLQVGFQPAAI